jgi:hypothetical protein
MKPLQEKMMSSGMPEGMPEAKDFAKDPDIADVD